MPALPKRGWETFVSRDIWSSDTFGQDRDEDNE